MKTARTRQWEAAQRRWEASWDERRLDEARRTWARLGEGKTGPGRQREVIRELVETREAELKQAYPDLLGLGYGVGTAGGEDKPTPCVMFLVRRKRKRVPRGRQLPPHLFVYETLGGRRVLCAVPTDVEEQHAYRSVVAHASETLAVSSGTVGPIPAMLTSPIRVRDENGQADPRLFALSCLHVLGMVQEFYPRLGPNCEFRPFSANQRIGGLSGYFGMLQESSEGFSFDAALGVVDDDPAARARLKQVLPAAWPTKHIFGPEEIPEQALILCHSGRGEVLARRRTVWQPRTLTLQYRTPAGPIQIAHPGLIEWDAQTFAGDSGSPVVAANDRDTLLGMHIAGDGEVGGNTAVMIPAYELFLPVRLLLSDGATLSIPKTI